MPILQFVKKPGIARRAKPDVENRSLKSSVFDGSAYKIFRIWGYGLPRRYAPRNDILFWGLFLHSEAGLSPPFVTYNLQIDPE